MLFIVACSLVALVALCIINATYNVYFHPLAKYPGPRLWAMSRIPALASFLGGKLPQDMLRAHEQYGEAVRVSPKTLSFSSPEAWNAIYGHGNTKTFKKDEDAYKRVPNQAPHLLNATDAEHSRFRRLLSHAFSDKALREQQPLLNEWVDKLMKRLHSKAGAKCDLVQWYNYTTFDIIGDLAFGDNLGCLDSSTLHPWVATIFDSLQVLAYLLVIVQFIPLELLGRVTPPSWWNTPNKHIALTMEKVNRRLKQNVERPDFLSYILRHNDEKGMSEPEIVSNASILLLAGSETTATALSGTTYWLLKEPETLHKLQHEIRSTFSSESDMTLSALANCKYLNAVLREGMRMYPPVPAGLLRECTVDDAVVAGYHVPKGTSVCIPQYSTYHLPANWHEPEQFKPSRWLQLDPRDKIASCEPFSTGPRNCIGQNLAWAELRLILARTIFNFDMELLDDSFNPSDQRVFVFWQKPQLNVLLKPRKEFEAIETSQ